MFITFEGGEGSGKTTQAQALHQRLTGLRIPAVLTYEPGGTLLGDHIRALLKWAQYELSPRAELLLFAAARAQLTTQVIGPALEQGKVVVCDRFAASSVAYQGYARGLNISDIDKVNAIATQGLQPDLTVLLDIAVELGLARKGPSPPDRFEKELLDFHKKLRQGYLDLAAADPRLWLVIDATLPQKQVEELIWQRVSALLPARTSTYKCHSEGARRPKNPDSLSFLFRKDSE
ncbi:MAG: dTMP kinase [Chloroflexi bacterium]|nr:dTMP kinase [Chloroflexota bacterium]